MTIAESRFMEVLLSRKKRVRGNITKAREKRKQEDQEDTEKEEHRDTENTEGHRENLSIGQEHMGAIFPSSRMRGEIAVLFILLLSYAFPTQKSSSVAVLSSVFSVFFFLCVLFILLPLSPRKLCEKISII
jgi:hypothetical protein